MSGEGTRGLSTLIPYTQLTAGTRHASTGTGGRAWGHRTLWGTSPVLGWASHGHSPQSQLPTSEQQAQVPCKWAGAQWTLRRRLVPSTPAVCPSGLCTWGASRLVSRALFLGHLGPPAVVAWPPGGHPGLSDCLWGALPSPLPSGDRPKPQCREGSSDPSSPPLLISPGPWKASTEKLPGGHEEAEDHPPDAGPRGEGAVRLWGAGIPGQGASGQGLSHLPTWPVHYISSHRKAGAQDVSSGQNLPGCQPARATGLRHGEDEGPQATSPSPSHMPRAVLWDRQGPLSSIQRGGGKAQSRWVTCPRSHKEQGQRAAAGPPRLTVPTLCRALSTSPTSCTGPLLWCGRGPGPAPLTGAPPMGRPLPRAAHPACLTSTASPWTGEGLPTATTRSGLS